ncbi:hypothetical protein [Halorussus gelatinilyticus]|uniref:hypothetical protein n=1 Tax=Halorussus gelatinilyticus TaxID=2937524 RepID=UPI0034A3DF63
MARRTPFRPSRIDAVEHDLERWLLLQTRGGVPELVLVGVLRDYADSIEHRGFVPRTSERKSRVTNRLTRRPRK